VIRYKLSGECGKPEAESFLSADYQAVELTEQQERDLYYFLADALYDGSLDRYVPSSVLSGNCFPNNDVQSGIDLGCSEPG